MQIQVLGTTVSEAKGKTGKPYKVIEVNYSRDGKQASKSLRSFSYPEVCKFFEGMDTFPQTVEVKSEKNDRGYWDWVSAQATDGSGVTAEKAQPAPQAGKKNVFEERDVRIVRQSSLERAVAVECHNNPKGAVDPEKVEALAERFSKWVLQQTPASMKDDIPF